MALHDAWGQISNLSPSLEAIFRHKMLRMLLNRGKITQEMIAMLSQWRHSGFNVFCGNRISPTDDTTMENLARCIIRESFSQERMQYFDKGGEDRLYGRIDLSEMSGRHAGHRQYRRSFHQKRAESSKKTAAGSHSSLKGIAAPHFQ